MPERPSIAISQAEYERLLIGALRDALCGYARRGQASYIAGLVVLRATALSDPARKSIATAIIETEWINDRHASVWTPVLRALEPERGTT